VLETEGGIRDRRHARQATAFKGAITFEHVSFGYSPVIRDAETSGGRTRQSVIPHFLSRASARPSGSNEESARRYRSRTGLPSSNVTRPERGSIRTRVSGSPPGVGSET